MVRMAGRLAGQNCSALRLNDVTMNLRVHLLEGRSAATEGAPGSDKIAEGVYLIVALSQYFGAGVEIMSAKITPAT